MFSESLVHVLELLSHCRSTIISHRIRDESYSIGIVGFMVEDWRARATGSEDGSSVCP